MIEKQHLIQIANKKMPFGKYAGRILLDIPEEYLLWMAKKGFQDNELGRLLSLTLAIKVEGSEFVLQPLRGKSIPNSEAQ